MNGTADFNIAILSRVATGQGKVWKIVCLEKVKKVWEIFNFQKKVQGNLPLVMKNFDVMDEYFTHLNGGI